MPDRVGKPVRHPDGAVRAVPVLFDKSIKTQWTSVALTWARDEGQARTTDQTQRGALGVQQEECQVLGTQY